MNSSFFKKNWYLLTPLLIVFIPMLMVVYNSFSYGYDLAESMKAVRNIGSTGTRYAQGFSERKFQSVRIGMDGKTVFGIIRNPMERNMPEDTEWRYSLPSSGSDCYHERNLIFEKDKNGIPRVKKRISRFHTP